MYVDNPNTELAKTTATVSPTTAATKQITKEVTTTENTIALNQSSLQSLQTLPCKYLKPQQYKVLATAREI